MAKTRWTGRGALVAIQSTSAGTPWINAGLSRSITPPPREKAAIDVMGMEDTFPVEQPGIEQASVFSFTMLDDSTDTVDALIETAYTARDTRSWRIRRYNGTYYWDETFSGKVSSIRPSAFGGSESALIEVSVVRNTSITYSVTEA